MSIVLIFSIPAFDCPEGTEYQMCGTACPNTCADRTAAENCPRPCHETCLCPDELVLDGEKCVAVEDCGCTLPNNVYLSVSSFTIDFCLFSRSVERYHFRVFQIWRGS